MKTYIVSVVFLKAFIKMKYQTNSKSIYGVLLLSFLKAAYFAGNTEFIKFEGKSEIFHYHKWQTVKKKKNLCSSELKLVTSGL